MVLAEYLGASVPREFGARRAEDLTIQEHPVPEGWVGRTLQEADPFRTSGLFVLAVRRDELDSVLEITPVPAEHAFREGDRIVLLGSRSSLDTVAG
jgi:Trk K+ transport system NAD-binding subunit